MHAFSASINNINLILQENGGEVMTEEDIKEEEREGEREREEDYLSQARLQRAPSIFSMSS